MKVNTLSLVNFRNYEHLTLEFNHSINILTGLNAQGKTNVLEAIYYGAMGRSHRTGHEPDLVYWNRQSCQVRILFSRCGIDNVLSFSFQLPESYAGKHKKEIYYNGQPIKPKELIGALNAVLFSPEDLLLIKGSPAGRRQFLDGEISQANPAYYQRLLQFNRIVAQRNILLKKIREHKEKKMLLEPWDEQFIQAAAVITDKRIESVKKLSMLANLMHRKITDNKENLVAAYSIYGLDENTVYTGIALREWYQKQLAVLQERDILHGSTGVGPHRDDLILKVNGVNVRNFGSQGQQRTGVLALKLAELEFIRSETGEYPVLLLDDVMSELDAQRRELLLSFIKDRIQTFITATDEQYFPACKQGKYYHVQAGTVMG